MGFRLAAAAVLGGLAAASWGTPARGELTVGDARITFRTDPSVRDCPDEASFVAAIARALERPVDAVGAAQGRLSFDVRAAPAASTGGVEGFVTVTSTTSTEPHRRALVGKTCREVAEGLALIVALSIDPAFDSLRAIEIPSPAADSRPPPPPPSPPPPASAPRPVPDAAPRIVSLAASLGAAFASATVPSFGVGGALGVAASLARGSRTTLAAQLVALAPVSTDIAGGSVAFQTVEARAALCPWMGAVRAFEAGPCLGGALTHVSTQSTGFASNPSSAATWLSGSLGARARLGLGPWVGIVADGAVFDAPVGHVWQLAGYGVVYDAAHVGFRGALGVDARF